jgi:hypothetical protein
MGQPYGSNCRLRNVFEIAQKGEELSDKTKLERLREQFLKIQSKILALEEEERDKISRPVLRQSVGKCFKFLNSYGSGEKWPLYCKITGFDEKAVTFETTQFQQTSKNIIEIEFRREYNFDGRSRFDGYNGWEEISNSEYNRAQKKALDFVNELLKEKK